MVNRRVKRFPKLCIFPRYRWCGPGCSGPGAPINEIDAACMMHDLCYGHHGPTCECDYLLLKQLRTLINPYTKEGRHARIIYRYMLLQTRARCKPHRYSRY